LSGSAISVSNATTPSSPKFAVALTVALFLNPVTGCAACLTRP
jgi:uncharacterized protein involved in exopolysaccharide biosynthesis